MSPSRGPVPPHRVQKSGTGSPINPARARCTTDGCGWESADHYGTAGPARAALEGVVHRQCEACRGSGHRSGGDTCATCEGSGYRPAPAVAR